MKRSMLLGVIAAMAASCTVQEADVLMDEMTETVFYATFEQPEEEETKVYANEQLLIRWHEDDRLSIFNKLTYNQQYQFTGKTGDNSGGFRKVDGDEFVTGNTLNDIVAVYPYQQGTSIAEDEVLSVELPGEQVYTQNTFGRGANTMVSVSSGNVLMFKNVGAYLMFSLYGEGISVSSITLKGNNGEKLSGKAYVTMPLNGVPSTQVIGDAEDASGAITLRCEEPVALGASAGACTEFWFVVPPVTFSRGFTITITQANGGTVEKSTSNTITLTRNKLSKMAPMEVGQGILSATPEYVDLGLSVKWATFNVGAQKPSDIGGRYAWGELETKSYYDWNNYKWCDGTFNSLTKYCTNAEYGKVDGKTVLDSEDDVASVLWGDDWRMPSLAELQELYNTCSWNTETLDGVPGYRVTGPNSNSIFLPFNGISDENGLALSSSELFLWSNETDGSCFGGSGFYFGIGHFNHRHNGLCIRPVYGKSSTSSPSSISIHLTNAGSLSEQLASVNCNGLTSITITGQMDARDFDFIKWECRNIENVDLSGVRIVEYTGAYGTNEGYKYTYPADEIPLGAFFYWTTHNRREVTKEVCDEGMPSLKKVILPEGIKAIRRNAFARAYNLTEINFPEGLESIDYVAFNLSFSLKDLIFPSTLKRIGPWAFDNCNDLREVHCKATAPPALSNNSWGWVPQGDNIRGWLSDEQRASRVVPVLYVPAESYYLYLQSDWALFFTDIRPEGGAPLPVPEAPEAVELGLSVKWATCNIGATRPEEYGDYFAWGETEPYYEGAYAQPGSRVWKSGKESGYVWPSYKWCNGAADKLTKYCTQRIYWDDIGPMDDTTVLDPEDDAAHINWGGSWRMPTSSECQELLNNCTWTWTSQNGVNGYKVASETNGNSIFLPAAGYRDGTSRFYVGSKGYYWSSSLNTDSPYFACGVFFSSGNYDWGDHIRYGGFSVRPVYGEFIPVASVTLDLSSLVLKVGESYTLLATISPSNATEKTIHWVSSDESVAFIDANGLVFAAGAGTATMIAYGSSGVRATCKVTVEAVPPSAPEGVEAVDLGLPSGLKWATCNVGATSPEEYGVYFAWGETAPKSNYDTYKWFNGEYNKITKYCTRSDYWDGTGPMDNKTVLDPEDDAAHVNWGGNWRMPTKAEQDELRNNCTWTWTTQGGKNGYKVTSKTNGNSIFLPAAGYRYGMSLYSVGSFGLYWSSSLYSGSPYYACYVGFSSDGCNWDDSDRYRGFSVRPVSE